MVLHSLLGLDSSMEGQDEIKRLRQQLKTLQKQARRWKSARCEVLQPTLRARLIAIVVFRLSQDGHLAATWCQRALARSWRHSLQVPRAVTALDIVAWTSAMGADPEVEAAMNDLSHLWRQEADRFLMESLVAEEVVAANNKGMHMSSTLLLQSFVRKWKMRPRCPALERWLNELVASVPLQKKWRHHFRRRWGMQWGQLMSPRTLSCAQIRSRTCVLVRWCLWLLRGVLAGQAVVVVNMDETGVSNVKDSKHGNIVTRAEQGTLDNSTNAKQSPSARCSLMAAITDDAVLQSVLPQVFLPRRRKDRLPTQETKRVFAEAGSPIEAWHGSSGYVTTPVIIAYMTRLRRAVRQVRPNAVLVLVFDPCGAHVNARVFRHARCLGIHIILIPGRMTWLLQPLDSHVFAQFKRWLRTALQKERMQATNGCLNWTSTMRITAEAVRAVLVQKDWSAVMQKSGLTQAETPLRINLQQAVAQEDLRPRPPTTEEVAQIVGCAHTWAAQVRRLLVSHLEVSTTAPSSMPHEEAVSQPPPVEEDIENILAPMLQVPDAATTHVNLHAAAPGSSSTGPYLPRARRLVLSPRNLMLRLPPDPPPETRVATRSQRRPLTPGFLEQESQTRRVRPRPDAG